MVPPKAGIEGSKKHWRQQADNKTGTTEVGLDQAEGNPAPQPHARVLGVRSGASGGSRNEQQVSTERCVFFLSHNTSYSLVHAGTTRKGGEQGEKSIRCAFGALKAAPAKRYYSKEERL